MSPRRAPIIRLRRLVGSIQPSTMSRTTSLVGRTRSILPTIWPLVCHPTGALIFHSHYASCRRHGVILDSLSGAMRLPSWDAIDQAVRRQSKQPSIGASPIRCDRRCRSQSPTHPNQLLRCSKTHSDHGSPQHRNCLTTMSPGGRVDARSDARIAPDFGRPAYVTERRSPACRRESSVAGRAPDP